MAIMGTINLRLLPGARRWDDYSVFQKFLPVAGFQITVVARVEIKLPQDLEFVIPEEGIMKNLREDPRVISAEYKDGGFYVVTIQGKFSFKFIPAEVREAVNFLAPLVEASGPQGAFIWRAVQNDCGQKLGAFWVQTAPRIWSKISISEQP